MLRVEGLELCSGSEAGSYLRLIDFVSLNCRLESNIRVIQKQGLEFANQGIAHGFQLLTDLPRHPA